MPNKPKGAGGGKLAASAIVTATFMSARSVRAQVSAAVCPHAKQVMVKITGGGRGMKAVAAHFRYISRLGKPEVGGKGQSLELEDENGDKVSGREGIEGLQYDWRMAGSYIPDESHRREVFNIVLSMPEGTPAPEVAAQLVPSQMRLSRVTSTSSRCTTTPARRTSPWPCEPSAWVAFDWTPARQICSSGASASRLGYKTEV